MSLPLVSVICLCHNHALYVREAVQSVLSQTYPQVEIIVVDDASADDSAAIIQQLATENPSIRILLLPENVGNCTAFNHALRLASGEYIVDLAADDTLLPERLSVGVAALEAAGNAYGVNFCDVWLLSPEGKRLSTHFKRNAQLQLSETVPSGDLYNILIRKHLISAPSMLIRRSVLEKLGGYDEQLSYEDFDFWIRSSREFNYCFTDEILVEKRILPSSLSTLQTGKRNKHERTTWLVCKKIAQLNNNRTEDISLAYRTAYECKRTLIKGNFHLSVAYFFLCCKSLLSAMSRN